MHVPILLREACRTELYSGLSAHCVRLTLKCVMAAEPSLA